MRFSIWTQLAAPKSIGGIWNQIAAIQSNPLLPGRANIWSNLWGRPGGMWTEVEDETLILNRRPQEDIWAAVTDETLIIRPNQNIWLKPVNYTPQNQQKPGIWAHVAEETLVIAPQKEAVWSHIAPAGKVVQQKPMRRLGWALKKLQTAFGEDYYILKNLRTGEYLRLTEGQIFLWNMMDGEHTIQDMAVAYFIQFKKMAIQGLLDFLAQLQARGFLMEQRSNAYANTSRALGQNRLTTLRRRLWKLLTETTISIKGVDTFFTILYRLSGWLIFNRIVQLLVILITLSGMAAFAAHTFSGKFSLLHGAGTNLSAGLVSLYIAQFLALLLHESSHALTCKHYGREVHRAGFMLYFGMPVFFVDTTDIWMEPRRPRMLVSWAGPYSGFFLAALASLLILITPTHPIKGLLFQFAVSCCLVSITNLNPLLKLDGYFLLMDWLEMPMLRSRSIKFITHDIWKKTSPRRPFTRDQKVFLIFGTLSLAWTVFALLSMVWLAGGLLLRTFHRLLGLQWGSFAATCMLAIIAAFLLLPFLKGFLTRRKQPSAAAAGV